MDIDDIVLTKVNISGVSSLSTLDISNFVVSKLSDQISVQIEWIDDNACNAVFPSAEHAALFLSLGTDSLIEYNESVVLTIRPALVSDIKSSSRSWKESGYYKKKLEEKGINPTTFKPVGKVILKPASHVNPSKVTLVPRKLVQQAKEAIYGDEAFSRKKNRKQIVDDIVMDEDDIAKRDARSQRFGLR